MKAMKMTTPRPEFRLTDLTLLPDNDEVLPTTEEIRAMVEIWNRYCTIKDLLFAGMNFEERQILDG
jgi:hypothetical protein